MNAIVPINVAAARVNINDASRATTQMKGRQALFEKMPYLPTQKKMASTGDKIFSAIQDQTSPANTLNPGVHLHWELPDFFRKGVQPPDGSSITFPAVPNRWLVIRHFSLYDSVKSAYGDVLDKAWVVESDYVSPNLTADGDGALRPAISVPLTLKSSTQSGPIPPYLYMGRKLDYEAWNPTTENPHDFLPYYKDQPGAPAYLNAIGFVGPSFAGYYPECSSVFGYWDRFEDLTNVGGVNVAQAVANNVPIQFRVSYQVFGWLDDASLDPVAGLDARVRSNYQDLWNQWQAQGVSATTNPAKVAASIAETNYGWTIEADDIPYKLDPDGKILSLTVPGRTLCTGQIQEIVWNMLDAQQQTIYYLANPSGQNLAIWTDTIGLAIGNTSVEGLSALLKHDLSKLTSDQSVLDDYELLLDAFQLGLLTQLEQKDEAGAAFDLDEALHSRAFAREAGGYSWIVTTVQQTPSDQAPNANSEVTLPLDLAEKLNLLNEAQKRYDQGRAQLDGMRKQLFNDWIRYVKVYTGEDGSNATISQLTNFLVLGRTGELAVVVQAGATIGLLEYQVDANGKIVQPLKPDGTTSYAYAVWLAFQDFTQALTEYPQWGPQCAPNDPFWQPTDLVAVIEGNRIEPVRRNGSTGLVFVRVSSELLSALGIAFQGNTTTIQASSVSGLLPLSQYQPMSDDVATLLGEEAVLTPMLAAAVAKALDGQQGPVKIPADQFIPALQAGQGGLSPLDPTVIYDGKGGLYDVVRVVGYVPAANPVQNVSGASGFAVDFTFTNGTQRGFAPSFVEWSAQRAYPEFTSTQPGYTRNDPFLPVFLIWKNQVDPLVRDGKRIINGTSIDYSATNLVDHFVLDADSIDYGYPVVGGKPKPFTTGNQVGYSASVTLSKKPVYSLTAQVDAYAKNYPKDPYLPALRKLADAYKQRRIMSQALDGFNPMQSLWEALPRVTVQDLTMKSDPITPRVEAAAVAPPLDNWYRFGFNGQEPIPTGNQAQYNFGPMRSGFASFLAMEIVDVFGQRMQLSTESLNDDGTLQAVPSLPLRPMPGDDLDKTKAYLPPRVLSSTRLWFRWVSARHVAIPGVTDDFVEMNIRPSTSPIFGWILPNHLDNSLFFYNDDGSAIGSFGLEHGVLVYRTRAGHYPDSLASDIGPPDKPADGVNPHLATFMWFVNDHPEGSDFLKDLMGTLQNSDMFLNSPSFSQDAGLAILIGRPVALARTVLSIETSGGLLPLNQSDLTVDSPFPQDVINQRYNYVDRQAFSAAALSDIKLPVRLGDLAKADDGLIGFMPEIGGSKPYGTIYSPSAPVDGSHGVVRPEPDTVEVTLNAPTALTFTILLDPRGDVHATTGVLPIAQLEVPSDQYTKTMRELAMTFSTLPILQRSSGLLVPLPDEPGYAWSWVQPTGRDSSTISPLQPQAVNGSTSYGYTPQSLLEGWLRLAAAEPLKPPTGDAK